MLRLRLRTPFVALVAAVVAAIGAAAVGAVAVGAVGAVGPVGAVVVEFAVLLVVVSICIVVYICICICICCCCFPKTPWELRSLPAGQHSLPNVSADGKAPVVIVSMGVGEGSACRC